MALARPRLEADAAQQRPVPLAGQPVDERQLGVELEPVPAVRTGDEEAAPRDAGAIGEIVRPLSPWEQVANQCGIESPAILTRLSKGGRTTYPNVARVLTWLGPPASRFVKAVTP